MWQPPLPIPWLPLQACHHGKEKKEECQPPVTDTPALSQEWKEWESCSKKIRLPVGCPLPQGCVWGTPQPAGAPRAGGCESQGWARWAKLGRSTLELGRAAVLGPRSCCWPERAEGAAASRDSELSRHRCLSLLLQLSQGPSFQIFVLLSVTMA